MPIEWQELIDNDDGYTSRLKVPGGWIVREIQVRGYASTKNIAVGLVFVPDELHLWSVDDE